MSQPCKLTTEAKRLANRRNALRSTGPKTPAGKARAAENACKHGLLSRAGVLVPGEDMEDFRVFEDELRTTLAPMGELEALLADRVVTCAWRLRRLVRVEVGVFSARLSERLQEKAARRARRLSMGEMDTPCDISTALHRLDQVLEEDAEDDEEAGQERERERGKELLERRVEACYEAVADIEEAADALYEEPALSGRIFARDTIEGDAFTKLSRYETSIERSLYRALHELERLQGRRAGQIVAPPVVVDMQVSGDR